MSDEQFEAFKSQVSADLDAHRDAARTNDECEPTHMEQGRLGDDIAEDSDNAQEMSLEARHAINYRRATDRNHAAHLRRLWPQR